ncbi:cytochrome c [Gemmatimonas sp.]|uniref:c-type cytochrome n=1 Tax=Gemmatimonas sp. TaxID=1962908 RepID=UPI00286C4E22|nr:cytochrome c [Gemmatimonas sp.]
MNTRITTLGLLTFALSGGALSAQNPFAARRPLTTTAGASVSRTGTPRAVTFTKDVAPILQQKCQSCHQPGSIAPMSLLTYADAKKYSRRIRDKVSARLMPPWHIDRTIGVQQFKNDGGLSDEQLATIVDWVDTGTPMGDPKDMPPAISFPDPNRWQLAEQLGVKPDLVIRSKPYTLAPKTQDKWFRPVVETGLTEPRWVRAIEVKPVRANDRKIVHHVLAYLLQPEQGVTGLASSAHDHQMNAGLFMEWAVGKTGQIFPEDAGKLMLPGSQIRWEVHMHAIGEEIKDSQVEMAVYFYPKGFVPAHRTVLRMFDLSRDRDLDIPPNEKTVTQNFYVMPAPGRLENFQPHMHMRGKAMSLEAVFPDGRREVISAVNNFQWNWHINYVYATEAAPLLPKGTTLVFTAWHDNTAANVNNPDPSQWVGWGDRTVDEMAHNWIDVTYLEQGEFDSLVAARKAKALKKPVP